MSTPTTAQPGQFSPEIAKPEIWQGRSPNPLVQALSQLVRHPMGAFGLGILVFLTLISILAPLIAPFDPAAQHPSATLLPPKPPYLLGTDEFGRDLLSRIIYGGRISLLVGFVAVALGAGVGVPLGLVAGYFGGRLDNVIMRSCDSLLALPGILLAIAILAVLGTGTLQTALALGIVSVPEFARLMRATVLQEREREYVLAARSVGTDDLHLMLRHVLPNAFGPILVQLSLAMSFAVLAEASLSFLGLGTGPPTPSWGGMLQESREYLRRDPWFGIFPGLALAILLLGLNYLSEALRDLLDPRLRDD